MRRARDDADTQGVMVDNDYEIDDARTRDENWAR